MRQGYKPQQAAQTLTIGMTTDFHDSAAKEIMGERLVLGQMLAGEGRQLAKELGR